MDIKKVYLKGQEEAKGWNKPDKIIIHHPEYNGSIEGLNDIMRSMGFYMIGYNFYVRKDGTVYEVDQYGQQELTVMGIIMIV
ncbi:hypothetical protein [Clostridium perfringens]|uniref:hypothetical protein n=1 Tax=Clostridium perfringens TaxID=1502 RepID=UPI00016BDD59|nr:hypothetical protein [Clostridium perfringens]